MVLTHNWKPSFQTKQPDAFSSRLAPARRSGCVEGNLSSLQPQANTVIPTGVPAAVAGTQRRDRGVMQPTSRTPEQRGARHV
jgi:hypothetical protein